MEHIIVSPPWMNKGKDEFGLIHEKYQQGAVVSYGHGSDDCLKPI